jgi:O-succinylbenzoate synthase
MTGVATGPGTRAPIATAELLEVGLPLREPFVTGFGATTTRRTALAHLVDADGAEGWGEAGALDHPYYLPETTATCLAVMAEYGLPMALAAGPEPGPVAAALRPIRGNSFAKAGVEAAFWVLAAAAGGRPLRDLVGGERDRIPVGESIGIQPTVEDTVAEAHLRVAEGYRRIKLKIRPGWDEQPVAAVRAALGGEVMLQVDANGSYRLDQADELARLDGYRLACIEQPLGWDELLGHAELQRRLRTPVCLDETLRSPADVRRALDLGACRNVNLKPGRVGGVAAAVEVHDLCRERAVPLWCGGMLESGIGRALNLALASLPGFTDPADMSPAAVLFERDLVDPTYSVDPDGFVAVPDAPGLGFPVDRDRLDDATIRRIAVPCGRADAGRRQP